MKQMPHYESKNLLRKSTDMRTSAKNIMLNSPNSRSAVKNIDAGVGQEELINFLENKLEHFEQNLGKKQIDYDTLQKDF